MGTFQLRRNLAALLLGVSALLPAAACARAHAGEEQEADVGERLARMYQEDQQSRQSGQMSPERDARRLEQVRTWVLDGRLDEAKDFYHAAMIFQHSTDRSGRDHLVAHVLATTAALKGHRPGRWLSAAALDRFLDFNDMPQVFGTQYVRDDDGVWHPGDVDPARTETIRLEFDLPDAATVQKRADGFNDGGS